MKKITTEQIEAILELVYRTNITARDFDSLKKFLVELPPVKEQKNKEG